MKKFCIFQPSIFKYHPEESGSSTVIIEYSSNGMKVHGIDTGSAGSDAAKAYQKMGITEFESYVFSHPHEDHMGDISNFCKKFKIKRAYFPTKEAFLAHSSTKGRANYIEKIYKQAVTECGAENVHYLKKGDSFTIGNVTCKVIFQADYKKLKTINSHDYPNNMSLGCLYTMRDDFGRTWTYYTAGDAAKEACAQFVAQYPNGLGVDFGHVAWHGDQAASPQKYCNALKGRYLLMDYHHSYKSSGRNITISRFKKAGGTVLGNYVYGDIWCDIYSEGYCLIHADKGLKQIKWEKYKPVAVILNANQVTGHACKVFADGYGSGDERIQNLDRLFGVANRKSIQNRVNVLDKDEVAKKYAFAAAVINGYFGSGDARKKALGNYKKIAQDTVDMVNKRKMVDYDILSKEIGKGQWGDREDVIKTLTGFKKYTWSKVKEACKTNGVKIKT